MEQPAWDVPLSSADEKLRLLNSALEQAGGQQYVDCVATLNCTQFLCMDPPALVFRFAELWKSSIISMLITHMRSR